MENSIEKDEEILNNIKTYMQENIDKGWHKFVYNDLGCHEKCVDVINAIEHILSEYKKVLKENGELREKVKQLEEENKKLSKANKIYIKSIQNIAPVITNDYIAKSKVKEKIEELNKLITEAQKELGSASKEYTIYVYQKDILQELLEKRK